MASNRSPHRKRLRLAAAAALTLLALAAAVPLLQAGASAQVVQDGGVSAGVQGRRVELFEGGLGTFENPLGNPVVASSDVYAVYWDPGDRYHGDWQKLIDGFLANLEKGSGALNAVFSVDGQYTDAAGAHAAYHTSFGGAYTDTSAYPTEGNCTDPKPLAEGDAVTCLTDAQIKAQLQSFVSTHGLPTGIGAIYYVLTPPGVTACLGSGGTNGYCSDFEGEEGSTNASYATSFCSYHSYIEGGGELGGSQTILYGVIPWTAGGLGDHHLGVKNRTPAYDCQAGGFEPTPEFTERHEEHPTQQEPNQIGLGPDGSYDTGLADLIVNQIAVEQQNIVTDPLLNGWRTSSGLEVTDECRNTFISMLGGSSAPQPHTEAGTLYNQIIGEGKYYLNDAYNLASSQLPYPAAGSCINHIALSPSFTTPEVVNAGEVVGFDGMESDITLNAGTAYASGKPLTTYPIYEWSFGDGGGVKGYAPGAPPANSPNTSPCELPWVAPCAASTFHSYAYGGTYTVTLKVTDTGGNTATISRKIKVIGPAPPAPPPSQSSSSPASSSAPTGSSVSGASASQSASSRSASKSKRSGKRGTGGSKPHRRNGGRPSLRPVAKALPLSRSLPGAVRKGLLVRYSVNQQVAGRFEVLIPSSLAKRLHIPGLPAKGLPAGSKRQTVIALHLLITMRGAHGLLRIAFPASDRKSLLRLRHLRLTLRLAVRNASRRKPKVAIVTTVVTLSR